MQAFSLDYVLAVLVFTAVTGGTPGPNTLMLLASGVNFGYRRTLPHIAGIALGFGFMVAAVGFGLKTVFDLYPQLFDILKWVGAAYMLILAWKVATAGELKDSGEATGKPFTFLQAALFQWVNPKAWAMAIASTTTYAISSSFTASVLFIAFVYCAWTPILGSCWALFGVGLRQLLKRPGLRRGFNILMGLLLVGSLVPVFIQG